MRSRPAPQAQTAAPRTRAPRTPDPAKQEHIQTLDSSNPLDPNNVPEPDLYTRDGEIKDINTFDPEVDGTNEGPPVERFTVVKGGMVQTEVNSIRARLAPGKIIDGLNYNIPLLRKQGVELEPVID